MVVYFLVLQPKTDMTKEHNYEKLFVFKCIFKKILRFDTGTAKKNELKQI